MSVLAWSTNAMQQRLLLHAAQQRPLLVRGGGRSRRCHAARPAAAAAPAVEAAQPAAGRAPYTPRDVDQERREGTHEAELLQAQVGGRQAAAAAAASSASAMPPACRRTCSHRAPPTNMQANKADAEQGSLAAALPAWDAADTADVAVVGCGPAGLALSAQLARLGLKVALVGRDAPFVNNYGVWLDEFRDLGLEDTLEASESSWRKHFLLGRAGLGAGGCCWQLTATASFPQQPVHQPGAAEGRCKGCCLWETVAEGPLPGPGRAC